MAEHHDATEEYLEAILEIEEEGVIPIRARLVERLGLSAPAVSETVNRLVENGYAELLDDRTLRLTAKGRERRRLHRPPPPPRRAPARRHHRARMGEGAQGGRPLGARDLGRRRGEARRPPRRSRDVPARQPDPRVEPQGRRSCLHPAHAVGARSGHRAPDQREGRDRRERAASSSSARSSSPAPTPRSSTAGPPACACRATPARTSSPARSPNSCGSYPLDSRSYSNSGAE